MSLISLDQNRDVSHSTVELKTALSVDSLTAAQAKNIAAYMLQATTTAMLQNAQSANTAIPVSGAFRTIANMYFSSTAGNNVPIAHNTNATTGLLRMFHVNRTTMDDGVVSGTITAVFSFGNTTGKTYVDIPEISLTGSIGRKGSMVEQGNTANGVGTVFYDWGAIVFHGGTGSFHFLVDSASGFAFGATDSTKLMCTQLSFQTLNVIKKTTYFCRAFNKELNYTNNPTAIADSVKGSITASLTSMPTTYITTVGLHNDDGDLLAVGKISSPQKKDFDKEVTVACSINY